MLYRGWRGRGRRGIYRERERLHRRGEVATEASRGIINSGSRKEPERERLLAFSMYTQLCPPSSLLSRYCVLCVCVCVGVFLCWSGAVESLYGWLNMAYGYNETRHQCRLVYNRPPVSNLIISISRVHRIMKTSSLSAGNSRPFVVV